MERPKEIRYAFIITIAILVLTALVFQAWKTSSHSKPVAQQLGHLPLPKAETFYGINLTAYDRVKGTIRPNEFLADILLPHGITYAEIATLSENSKPIKDVRGLGRGKDYEILTPPGSDKARYFIYKPGRWTQYIYDLESLTCEEKERVADVRMKMSQGKINANESLWGKMDADPNMDSELAKKIEDALAWSIDFKYLQAGDSFNVYYEDLYLDGDYIEPGDIKAVYFQTDRKDYHAIYFEDTKYQGYYDLNGVPMRKAFLRAPVKSYRLSSAFSMRRFHPVDKRYKPHLGTDYAAKIGTPIQATADGVISRIGFTRGNGNFIKVKHDDTYSTQYLHMQRFAKGMAKGVHVKQGETIGYVGMTGKATGPHVCYRFWKNGRQVDPRKQNLPEPDPMPKEDLPKYFQMRDKMLNILSDTSFFRASDEDLTL